MLRQAASLLSLRGSVVLRSVWAETSTSTSSSISIAAELPFSSALPRLLCLSLHGSSRIYPSPTPSPTSCMHATATHQRLLHSSSTPCTSSSAEPASSEESISVTFIGKDNKPQTIRVPLGKNLLEAAHDNEIDLEGACEGSLACSTCHVIVENPEYYKRMPEPSDDELDMLDMAFGLTDTSRLGCQVVATKDLDGLIVRIPAASRNFYVDGHKPKPH